MPATCARRAARAARQHLSRDALPGNASSGVPDPLHASVRDKAARRITIAQNWLRAHTCGRRLRHDSAARVGDVALVSTRTQELESLGLDPAGFTLQLSALPHCNSAQLCLSGCELSFRTAYCGAWREPAPAAIYNM